MKKIVSLVLALSMVLSMFTFSFAGTTLPDVEGTAYEAAVSALVELGIVEGYDDGEYKAERTVTRAQMAKMLVIASGLEDAAELNMGGTNFSDVAANHWATGFINVAAEYGYINGYPDGTFKPEKEVKYSEAVTMVIRALGYKSVVEAEGTWPTNYIQKARELKVLDNNKIKYDSYNDGATRGNIALVIWNTLRTDMWDIKGESETTGLEFGYSDKTMIEKYFDDYTYTVAEFESFKVDEGKVYVSLSEVDDGLELEAEEYEYLANDFYTFVPGTEVEVLVNENEDNETLLMMVNKANQNLFDGTKAVVDEEYDELSGDAEYDYAYARIEKKAIDTATVLDVENEFIREIEIDEDDDEYITINDESYEIEEWDEEVIVRGDERIKIKDVKANEVLSTVTVSYYGSNAADATFYVVSNEKANGELTKIVEELYENEVDTYYVATIGGEKYTIYDESEYVEDVEDDDTSIFFEAWTDDMKGEEVVAYLDFLGRVTFVEFDGEIGGDDEDDDYTVGFYAATGTVERETSKTYSINLENEANKAEDYAVIKSVGSEIYAAMTDLEGYYCAIMFNDEGEVEAIAPIANADSVNEITEVKEYTYNEDGDAYVVVPVEAAEFDDENSKVLGTVSGEEFSMKVSKDTVVVTLIKDDKDTVKTTDDVYTVEFTEGIEDIENLKDEYVLVIYDDASRFAKAKYVVLFDEVSVREDDLFGIIKEVAGNEIGDIIVTIKGAKDELLYKEGKVDIEDYAAIMYAKEENDDGEYELEFISGVTKEELSLSGEVVDGEGHAYIPVAGKNEDPYTDGREAILVLADGNTMALDLDDTNTADTYEDYKFIVLKVSKDKETDRTDDYKADSLTIYEAEEVFEDSSISMFQEKDRVSVDTDNNVILVIRGMAERTTTAAN